MTKRMTSQMVYVKSKAPYFHEEELEIVLVLKGKVKVTKMERAFDLNEGEFTLINRHIVHYLESQEGAQLLVTYISLKEFKTIFNRIEHVEFLNNNEIYEVERPLKYHLNAIVIDTLIKIYQLQNEIDKEKEIEFEENQLVYMLFLNYQLITHIKQVEEYPTSELMDRYYQVVEYIMNNIHTKIMTEDIVNLVYMNPTYFSQFMKRVGGVGFKEFVFYRKLIMICKYLLSPDLTMNETALKVGITDMKSFYSNFKKTFKISPSKWRQKIALIKDDYQLTNDMTILNDFIEKNHIHRHRENTITKTLKFLLKCKEEGMDLSGVNIEFNPYEDMGDTFDPDYQVYKHFGALTKTSSDMGCRLMSHFPVKYLMIQPQCDLFISALNEHVLLFGLQTMKKDRIILHTKTFEELDKAKEIVRLIDRKVGHLHVLIAYEV